MKLSYEVLETILDKETFLKLISFCAGYEVVFPKNKINQELILIEYKKLKNQNIPRAKIVSILAKKYDKSKRRIYDIIKEIDD